ncbi:MAG TPA: leucine zipper domain-containing protein [Bradyrhizobium sp.]|nr:leucine zipper domain-containing protein [Bradyrhizobium sp.]
MSELIPDDVRKFILENIDSVAELEALLLLRRSSDQAWSIENASKRLYVSESTAAHVLNRLSAAGLSTRIDDLYRYQPRTRETGHLVDRLAETYDRYLIPVTNLIHEKPSRIQNFADAFRIRKDK